MLNSHVCNKNVTKDSLIDHAYLACKKHDFSFIRYAIDDKYALKCRSKLQAFPVNDGVVDSVRLLLFNDNEDIYDHNMLNLLLSPF